MLHDEVEPEMDVEIDEESLVEVAAGEEFEDVELEISIDDDEETTGVMQVPSPFGKPLSHLQLREQPSPLTVFPSSHSSPKAESHLPSPQAAGVAPRLRMYGSPMVSSPKVLLPSPMMSLAMARAWKPLTPVVGYSEKASWTLQPQFESAASSRLPSAGEEATMWALL